jgi:hypothetical protein
MAVRPEGTISASLIVIVVVATAIGAVVGLLLDGLVGSRTLAVLSGLIATVLASIARYTLLYRISGAGTDETRIPTVLVVNGAIASIAGSLAAHDLSGTLQLQSPVFLGALAGLLSAVLMALLMITYHNNPEPRG